MKRYSMTWKDWTGKWSGTTFEATCDTDARFTARAILRKKMRAHSCGFTLMSFSGRYIKIWKFCEGVDKVGPLRYYLIIKKEGDG